MDEWNEYMAGIDEPEHRARMEEIFAWIQREFPQLERKIAWNQPMFTDHGTFIIGFSPAKEHLSVAPEGEVIAQFSAEIAKAGYSAGKKFFRMPWKLPVDYALLKKIIESNRLEKADVKTFWRKGSC
ncbi:MAG: iron chaperone [Eubacteriales bacterium]|nr:iron chaperone [Eubacteriales bacterium]